MSDLETKFNTTVQEVQELVRQGKKLSQVEELKIYALYKRATVGDVDIPQPGMFDLKARAKWNAWNAVKVSSKEEAKQQYIEFCESLREKLS